MAYASLPSRVRAAPRESFDSHCSRDCQQARRWCSSRLHHPTAPLRSPPRASRTRTASPLTGRGRSTYQPPECQLAIPPPRGEGEQRTDQICALAIKQLTNSRGALRRRSLKLPRRPRQPATSRQGARRGAHRRPPHTSHHRQTVPSSLGERTHPARNSLRSPRAADQHHRPRPSRQVGHSRCLPGIHRAIMAYRILP